MSFKKAERAKLPLRMALMGPTKGGKSYTGLSILHYLVEPGKRIAVIDTEHGRTRLYAAGPGEEADPSKGRFDFDVLELDNFDPKNYIAAINDAVAAGIYGGLLIDSFSHAWVGQGGVLDQKATLDANPKSNSYTNWAKLTPLQDKLVEAVMAAPMHVIVTMRSRMEYALETNERGKVSPRKIGLAPQQRKDVEYEFDVLGEMNAGAMTMVGTRVAALPEGMTIQHPGAQVAAILRDFLNAGGAPPSLTKKALADKLTAMGWPAERMKQFVARHAVLANAQNWDELLRLARLEEDPKPVPRNTANPFAESTAPLTEEEEEAIMRREKERFDAQDQTQDDLPGEIVGGGNGD